MSNFFDSKTLDLKICGITQPHLAQSLIELGVHALGFNFWPQSKRYLDPSLAQKWLPQLESQVIRIGLFVNQPLAHIEQLYKNQLFDYAQLHGEESPEFVSQLLELGIPCIKALRIKGKQDISLLSEFDSLPLPISALLLDAYHPQEQGGSGHSFDWEIISHPSIQKLQTPIILAGGININNIKAAAQVPGISALDLASGAESKPGTQDLELVKQLLSQLN